MPQIERLKIPPMGIGEGPHWKADTQCLYMVDALGSIVKYSPKTEKTVISIMEDRTTFIIPVNGKEDEFVIGSKLNVFHIKWDVEANKILRKDVLVTLTDELTTNRICDAKCDEKGRLWFGTLSENFSKGATDASFYSYSTKEGLKKHLTKIGLSNGIAFSADNKKMYHIDSPTYKINEFDFDIVKGAIKLKKTVIDFKKANLGGMPDGMTIDTTGKLWIACVMGSRVIQVDPESSQVLQTIKFEKSNLITSVAFGGSFLDELYVTSANIPHLAADAPEAGCTYKVTDLGATGRLASEFDFYQ